MLPAPMTYEEPSLAVLSEQDQASCSGTAVHDWRVRRLRRAAEAQHGGTQLTLGRVCTTFGLTPSHLGKLFKHDTGQSFRSFSTGIRLKYGAELLIGTDLTIKQIAAALGYRHPGDFNYAFKCVYSTTPKQFRQWKRYIAME